MRTETELLFSYLNRGSTINCQTMDFHTVMSHGALTTQLRTYVVTQVCFYRAGKFVMTV